MNLKDFLEEESRSLMEGFYKTLEKVIDDHGPSSVPYYVIYHIKPDVINHKEFREVFAFSKVKPPYDPRILVFMVEPRGGTFRLEEEYKNPNSKNLKSVITADDVTFIDHAVKKEFKMDIKA